MTCVTHSTPEAIENHSPYHGESPPLHLGWKCQRKGQPNKIKQGYANNANTCGTIKAEANISNHFREDGVRLGVPKSLSQILSS